MANIVLFSDFRFPSEKQGNVDEQREQYLRQLGHDVFSFADYPYFAPVLERLPHIDVIVACMTLTGDTGGYYIKDLRKNPVYKSRFKSTPIIGYSRKADVSGSYVMRTHGITEYVFLSKGPKFGVTLGNVLRMFVPNVPYHYGKASVYNPLRPGSLITASRPS